MLNEEEKDFIKDFINKYIKNTNEYYDDFYVQLTKRDGVRTLWFYVRKERKTLSNPIVKFCETKEYFISASIDKFNQLEMGRDYTMEELGINLEEK